MLSTVISKQLHATPKKAKNLLLVLMAITRIKQEDGEIECTQQIPTDVSTISHRSSE